MAFQTSVDIFLNIINFVSIVILVQNPSILILYNISGTITFFRKVYPAYDFTLYNWVFFSSMKTLIASTSAELFFFQSRLSQSLLKFTRGKEWFGTILYKLYKLHHVICYGVQLLYVQCASSLNVTTPVHYNN